jgi:hypothetical protein
MTDQIAQTIISQLGGYGRLKAMIGLISATPITEPGLAGLYVRFRARARRRINALAIRLDPTDTYTVQFWAIRACEPTLVASYSEVYADGLRDLVEGETGLALSLGPVTLPPPAEACQ